VSSLSLVCRALAGAASLLPSGVTSGSEGRSGALFPGTINGWQKKRRAERSRSGPLGLTRTTRPQCLLAMGRSAGTVVTRRAVRIFLAKSHASAADGVVGSRPPGSARKLRPTRLHWTRKIWMLSSQRGRLRCTSSPGPSRSQRWGRPFASLSRQPRRSSTRRSGGQGCFPMGRRCWTRKLWRLRSPCCARFATPTRRGRRRNGWTVSATGLPTFSAARSLPNLPGRGAASRAPTPSGTCPLTEAEGASRWAAWRDSAQLLGGDSVL
ncbi:hypothetical protein T484DRAFT_2827160, partial [Baffinella frigidus]